MRRLKYGRNDGGIESSVIPASACSARIVLCSSPMASRRREWASFARPFGWGLPAVETYIREQIDRHPHISARELSRALVARAVEVDGLTAKDDITCGVVYVRSPRQLLVMTGAPFNRVHDQDLAKMAERTPGRKVICGGTTANIISRQLNRSIEIDLRQRPRFPRSAHGQDAGIRSCH